MNEPATAQRSDVELHLETEFYIDLRRLSNRETDYTIEQFIAALEATSSLTNLSVDFFIYEPAPVDMRRIVEPLCRCIANLRCRNEHHPLRALTLYSAHLREGGMWDVFEQFLLAATKYRGIYRLELADVQYLPMPFFVEFCHNNNNLKVVEMTAVIFSDGGATISLPPNRPQKSSVMPTLDELMLISVSFENSTASTAFANFIARMTVRALELGKVWAYENSAAAAAAAAADDDLQMTNHILSEIKLPPVTQLTLQETCRIQHFKAALEAGTNSLIELEVAIDYDKDDYTERLELAANFIRRAVQLNNLTFTVNTDPRWDRLPLTKPSQIFRAVEECATVTWIRLIDDEHFLPEIIRAVEACATVVRIRMINDEHFLQDITTRNEELARFVASPNTYSSDKLLWLMRQFDNCPTGRYMLARSLPGVISFEKGNSMVSPASKPKQKRERFQPRVPLTVVGPMDGVYFYTGGAGPRRRTMAL